MGPWSWYLNSKGNSIVLKRYLVPWLIALHGIGFAKMPKYSTQVSEMILALCTEHGFLQGSTTSMPEQAAELYPIAFQDVCERARNAASKPILLTYRFYNCTCIRISSIDFWYRPNVKRCPADRSINAHRKDVREALIVLFEKPVLESSEVKRKVLTRILCNPAINFDQLVLDFKSSVHLGAMAKLLGDIVTAVVWESTNGTDAKTVLHNFKPMARSTSLIL